MFVHSEHPWELNLVQGATVTLSNLDLGEHINFFETITSHVMSAAEGGHIDIFAPLASCGKHHVMN